MYLFFEYEYTIINQHVWVFSAPSLACDFTKGDTCGYKPNGIGWTFSSAFASIGPGVFETPTVQLSITSTYCFGFSYSIASVDSLSENPVLSIFRDDSVVWSAEWSIWQLYSTGQVTLDGGLIDLQFRSIGPGSFQVYETTLNAGACDDIAGSYKLYY